nr:sugar transport-like protein [Fagopyrum tataricum]
MEVGGSSFDGNVGDSGGMITFAVAITCIVAASSGLIFGYDIGISGGVTTMTPFLRKFFPSVLSKAASTKRNLYCVYDSQLLTAFTSSLYIAAMVSSLMAGRLNATFGRKFTLILGGSTFIVGAAMNSGAENVEMLIVGRILLGFGIGFANQAAPIYLSEVAPTKWRGAFSTAFQFFVGIGVMTASCINYATSKHEHGWRLSLGLAAAPALIMTLGTLLISDTPSSLVERGKLEEAKGALVKIRGHGDDVEAELVVIVKANEANMEPFRTIFKRQYRPQLIMAILIPFFDQLTGINITAFYAPALFRSIGFGSDSALLAAIILGAVTLCSIVVSALLVDRFGRRVLFLKGGMQMCICQVGVAVVLAASTKNTSTQHIPKTNATLVLVFMCIYVSGFGLSWGPLSWLVPSEIFPLKIRQTGQSISTAVHFAMLFVLSQTFLAMFCHFKYGAFLFYAAWLAVMTVFVAFFMPETKGIPLESMHVVWERHWFWKHYLE